ncbi:DUF1488 family protein [Robbsia andropogonis]|uniref:DUF1488 family protein n=1 Tax=Robbsia andropogonis TaxID=28092 RepID=UPI0020A10926|nr:DUF1488 family protein [Robbsia andropogonis]MCP1118881.1 DUF1488 domain-containing protein [Robbsia andropogonis]MCP1128348.1 DUF1488 domain-containing protein [Robbsia andropogonis]
MDYLSNLPVIFVSGDLQYNDASDGRGPRAVRVSRECLEDVFGADGTQDSMRRVFHENMTRIQAIARKKIFASDDNPVLVVTADFR